MMSTAACPTCGLSRADGSAATHCTAYCAKARHRYPRAIATLRERVVAARASEEMDRPDIAKREHRSVELWRSRVQSMQDHIVAARREAGLPVDPGPRPTPEEIEESA
jgi:hypothetical protein